MRYIFDIVNVIALILIGVGVGFRLGWDVSAMVVGALMMALNFRIAAFMKG